MGGAGRVAAAALGQLLQLSLAARDWRMLDSYIKWGKAVGQCTRGGLLPNGTEKTMDLCSKTMDLC